MWFSLFICKFSFFFFIIRKKNKKKFIKLNSNLMEMLNDVRKTIRMKTELLWSCCSLATKMFRKKAKTDKYLWFVVEMTIIYIKEKGKKTLCTNLFIFYCFIYLFIAFAEYFKLNSCFSLNVGELVRVVNLEQHQHQQQQQHGLSDHSIPTWDLRIVRHFHLPHIETLSSPLLAK